MRSIHIVGILLFNAVGVSAQTVANGEMLAAGKELKSEDGRYTLTLKTSGNLIWQSKDKVLWQSNTEGIKNPECHLQKDGNFVVYSKVENQLRAEWASGTAGHEGARLICQNDGNLVIYQGSTPIWASKTVVLEPKELMALRWKNGKEIYSQLQTDLSEMYATTLRNGAVLEKYKAAHKKFQDLPRDADEPVLNDYFNKVTKSLGDSVEILSRHGDDATIEKFTPDTNVNLYVFRIRLGNGGEAIRKINDQLVRTRKELMEAQDEVIKHLRTKHKVEVASW